MHRTLTQIGADYGISAILAGKVLYALGVRDPDHPVKKGFPYDQYVTHHIAEAVTGRDGRIRCYRYDIGPIRAEFEAALTRIRKHEGREKKVPPTRYLYEKTTAMLQRIRAVSDAPSAFELMIPLGEELDAMARSLLEQDPGLSMPLDSRGKALLERLKAWRAEKAKQYGRPAFAVMGNTTLHAIAYERPEDEETLCSIKGIGAKKIEQFGSELLAIVRHGRKEG
jgi:hypothetical protein